MGKGYFMIVGYPRSGSTFLCSLVEELSPIKVYREIFHDNFPVIRQTLGPDADHVLRLDLSEDEQHKDILTNPMAHLARIDAFNPDTGFFFKVFGHHLQPEAIRQVIAGSNGTIFLRRNLVHAFISNQIAFNRMSWGGDITSSDLIHFDIPKFLWETRVILERQRTARQMADAAGIRVVDCWYDEIAEPGLGEGKVLQMMDSLGIARKPAPTWIAPHRRRPTRQDGRRRASDKVSNRQELLATLQDLGIPDADDDYARTDVDALLTRLQAR
jgi:hypothetical protein